MRSVKLASSRRWLISRCYLGANTLKGLTRAFGIMLAIVMIMAPACVVEADGFVGKPAPEIQVEEWINAPERTNLATLRGKVVLLEFWATW